MVGCSQEVFSVPGLENTRPKQGNAFTCHNQEQHAVITQLGRQAEYVVLHLLPWNLLHRSREWWLALTNSTDIREIKIGSHPAWLIFSEWEMLQWGTANPGMNWLKTASQNVLHDILQCSLAVQIWAPQSGKKKRVVSCRFAVATSWAKKIWMSFSGIRHTKSGWLCQKGGKEVK